jgi:aspartate carbamoyltransferase catalytic subunit
MSIKHLINSSDLIKKDYDELLAFFDHFTKKGIPSDMARGKVVATLFFQPSTRTMTAFQSAMIRMGGGWVGVSGDTSGISMGKGESFEDTIREYSCFADAIALRHQDDDSAERAAQNSFVPILNCGSGSREHAVAAPWMIMALQHHVKKPLKGLKVGIYGTPEINRVTKAMVPIFGMYGIDLVIDDLGHFPLPKDIEEKALKNGLKSLRYGKLDDFIGEVDILLLTRGLQKGIIPPDKFPKEKEEIVLKSYKPINTEHMKKLRKDAVLYIIKPRIFEIEKEVDADPRAAYTKEEPYVEMSAAVLAKYLNLKV